MGCAKTFVTNLPDNYPPGSRDALADPSADCDLARPDLAHPLYRGLGSAGAYDFLNPRSGEEEFPCAPDTFQGLISYWAGKAVIH
jgi:hypothetical protein